MKSPNEIAKGIPRRDLSPLEQIKAWLLQQKHEREVSCMSESSFALRMFNQDQLKDEIIEKLVKVLWRIQDSTGDESDEIIKRTLSEVAEIVREK